MAKVSTDGMRGTAGEIKSLIDVLKNKATSTAMGAERMSQAASVLTGYNGQTVQGTVVNTNQFDGKHVSHYKEYQTWIINTNGVEELASSVAKKAEALEAIASKISGEADVINSISEQIEGYITTIQSTIGDNISATAITTAFKALGQNGVTKANLAVSGDLINNRDFLDFNQIKTDPNLQGGVLTFEKQDDGTYKVLKNGGGTGYYTTGLAAAFYMKTLVTTAKNETILSTTNDKLPLKGEEALNNIKKGVSNIVDETKQNYKNFTEGTTKARDKINSFKDNLSGNSSKDAIQIDYPNNTKNLATEYKARWQDDLFSQSLMGKQDYVIPEGKSLYLKDSLIAQSGDVLKYDSASNNYFIFNSEGQRQNLSNYTPEVLSNGTFKNTLLN